jgi:hypothetical protein
MSTTSVPGGQLCRATITDECRSGRGDEGAIDEAVRRIRQQAKWALTWWAQGSGAKVHVVVTLEKPVGS